MAKTEYVLSLSYGKDSLACLEAIKQLGYPLDRIITAEVWATDTIPADLPPMVEFKAKADRIIKERYGITVEHTCAMRESDCHSRQYSIQSSQREIKWDESTVSLCETDNGAPPISRARCSTKSQKVTYEGIFYHIPQRKPSAEAFQGMITGFPHRMFPWCNSKLKVKALSQLAFQ